MNKIDYSHFLERYIAGEMDENELKWFESELDGNTALRKELHLRQQTDSILAKSDLLTLKMKLAAIDENHRSKVRSITRQRKAALKAVAVFAGIILIGSLLLIPGSRNDKQALYNKYFVAYEAPSNTRSQTIGTDAMFQNAIEAYQAEDYQAAITFLEKVLSREENKIESRFLLGVSQMEISKYRQAGQNFQKVIDHNDNMFIEEANWYLGLCYLMTDDRERAIEQFMLLENSSGIYKKRARKLLRHL